MARQKAITVSVIILLLGLAAAGLCFIANAKRIKPEEVAKNKQGVCVYPGSSAFGLGIVAAIIVLIQQIVVSGGIGCFCCTRDKTPCNCCGILSLILFICSWLSFIITILVVIFAALYNTGSFLRQIGGTVQTSKGGARLEILTKDGCLVGMDGIFTGAAIWCLINLAFSLVCYATFVWGVKRSHKRYGAYGGNFTNV